MSFWVKNVHQSFKFNSNHWNEGREFKLLNNIILALISITMKMKAIKIWIVLKNFFIMIPSILSVSTYKSSN